MIERIVVPLDGSQTAEAILPQVRRLLRRNDSEVFLVRAVVPPPVEDSFMVAETSMGEANESLRLHQEILESAGARVTSIVRVGSPVGVILDVVEEEHATMIAIATHGASGVSRLLMGSVAESLLRKATVPVLALRPFWTYEVAPEGGAELYPIRDILYPVDGREHAEDGLPSVMELARLFDSRIVLLRVLESKKASREECEDADAQLKRLASKIEKKGVETARLLESGHAVDQILKAVKTYNVDLLALTTEGRRGLRRALFGSVTEEVLRKAPVPVLVTHKTALKKHVLAGMRSGRHS